MRNSTAIFLSIAFAAVIGAAAWAFGNAYHLRIVFMMCIYYLCASGTNVLVGYAGQKSLGQAGLFAVGAYTAALASTLLLLDPWLALLAAVVVSAVFGVVLALPSLRAKGPYLAMVTLAFGIVVEKIVTEWSDLFGGAQGIYGIQGPSIQGVPFSDIQWVWLGLAMCLAVHLLLRGFLKGKFGRTFLAVQADEIAAGSSGINVYSFKVLAFVISAVTCGIAGALVAQQNQYINSDFVGFPLSIFILLLVLFGGAGMLYGPLIGAVLLVLIDAFLSRWPNLQHLVYGALLLFALYVLPKGLAGLGGKLFSHAGRGVPPSPCESATSAAWSGLFGEAVTGDDMELLSVHQLCKSYGGVKPAQNIDLSIRAGHIHALIGPNGAGKSTMINMISAVVQADSGNIRFLGKEVGKAAPHDVCGLGISRTFQNLRLFADLPVLDNVLIGRHSKIKSGFWSSLLNLPSAQREERRARVEALLILAWLGLSEYAQHPAGGLAYGLQRRVELARSLASHPRLLLLDEPAAGLNPLETAELGRLLVRIREAGITILMVEHHMDLVMNISNHVTVLDYGIKIAEGTPQEIQNNPVVIAAYLGAESDPDCEAAIDEACAPQEAGHA
ncbi:ATP-binding cassette domain-containing protein [Herbaspirillum sp. RV1423]|uniref:branched-chain amino acid ABC transporter ATP-binding protein/permease n=1 Tax=Herbaspirillum sp. RV1423 TaxID=1443993 RepID=UPI0004AD6FC5|nr:branched-chain amino acid ABC transporter ATP-binding protein/permease [Herbaspirillum sp. RV1423]